MAKKNNEPNQFEIYFTWWAQELQKYGLVREIHREPESITVLEPVVLYTKIHYAKKEPVYTSHNLLKPSSYTWDYTLEMHRSLLDKFIGVINKVNDNYFLKEIYDRTKGDSFYDFKYYYFEDEFTDDEYVNVGWDVKGPPSAVKFSAKLGSSREFPYNQKLALERRKMYVNKVVPCQYTESLFNKSFMPNRYLITDGGTQMRKLKPTDKKTTIEEWMEKLNLKKV